MPTTTPYTFRDILHGQKFDLIDDANNHYTWLIDEVIHYINTTPPREISVITWKNIDETMKAGKLLFDVDEQYVDKADLTIPCIIGQHPDGHVIIDGSKRFIKAHRSGHYVFSIFLTLEETNMLMRKI